MFQFMQTNQSSQISTSPDFLSSIIHELKTPISAIIGFSEILEDEVKNPKFADECAYYAKEINSTSLELLDIVHDLLDIGAANSGNFSVDLSLKIDVLDVVRRSIRLNWDYALKRNVRLKLEVCGNEIAAKLLASDKQNNESQNGFGLDASAQFAVSNNSVITIPPINLDAKRIKQILTNIISNALKYSPDKTEVKISVNLVEVDEENSTNKKIESQQVTTNGEDIFTQNVFAKTLTTQETVTTEKPYTKNKPSNTQTLEIKISDQGFGMSTDQLSNLFTRYKTFQNPNSGKVDSTGLGLPITKQLIELQNGQILVKSELNKGTEITLKFPYAM